MVTTFLGGQGAYSNTNKPGDVISATAPQATVTGAGVMKPNNFTNQVGVQDVNQLTYQRDSQLAAQQQLLQQQEAERKAQQDAYNAAVARQEAAQKEAAYQDMLTARRMGEPWSWGITRPTGTAAQPEINQSTPIVYNASGQAVGAEGGIRFNPITPATPTSNAAQTTQGDSLTNYLMSRKDFPSILLPIKTRQSTPINSAVASIPSYQGGTNAPTLQTSTTQTLSSLPNPADYTQNFPGLRSATPSQDTTWYWKAPEKNVNAVTNPYPFGIQLELAKQKLNSLEERNGQGFYGDIKSTKYAIGGFGSNVGTGASNLYSDVAFGGLYYFNTVPTYKSGKELIASFKPELPYATSIQNRKEFNELTNIRNIQVNIASQLGTQLQSAQGLTIEEQKPILERIGTTAKGYGLNMNVSNVNATSNNISFTSPQLELQPGTVYFKIKNELNAQGVDTAAYTAVGIGAHVAQAAIFSIPFIGLGAAAEGSAAGTSGILSSNIGKGILGTTLVSGGAVLGGYERYKLTVNESPKNVVGETIIGAVQGVGEVAASFATIAAGNKFLVSKAVSDTTVNTKSLFEKGTSTNLYDETGKLKVGYNLQTGEYKTIVKNPNLNINLNLGSKTYTEIVSGGTESGGVASKGLIKVETTGQEGLYKSTTTGDIIGRDNMARANLITQFGEGKNYASDIIIKRNYVNTKTLSNVEYPITPTTYGGSTEKVIKTRFSIGQTDYLPYSGTVPKQTFLNLKTDESILNAGKSIGITEETDLTKGISYIAQEFKGQNIQSINTITYPATGNTGNYIIKESGISTGVTKVNANIKNFDFRIVNPFPGKRASVAITPGGFNNFMPSQPTTILTTETISPISPPISYPSSPIGYNELVNPIITTQAKGVVRNILTQRLSGSSLYGGLNIGGYAVKESLMTTPKIQTVLDIGGKNAAKSVSSNINIVKVATLPNTREAAISMPTSIAGTIAQSINTSITGTSAIAGTNIPSPIITPMRFIIPGFGGGMIPPLPSFGSLDFGFPGKRNIKGKQKKGYTPSYTALAFKIYGKKPKGTETGLRFRPITKGFKLL